MKANVAINQPIMIGASSKTDNKRAPMQTPHLLTIEGIDYKIENDNNGKPAITEIVSDPYVSKIFDYRQGKIIYQNIEFELGYPHKFGYILTLDGKNIDDKKATKTLKRLKIPHHIKIIIKNPNLIPVKKDNKRRGVHIIPYTMPGVSIFNDCVPLILAD